MNQKELIKTISEKIHRSETEVTKCLEALTEVIRENIGDDIKIAGLGFFCSKFRKARTGRNPTDGTDLEIPDKWVPAFRPNKKFKEATIDYHSEKKG